MNKTELVALMAEKAGLSKKDAEKAQKAALKTQPKYKSLHYIDEDDYDELPTIKGSDKKTTKLDGVDAPQIKD